MYNKPLQDATRLAVSTSTTTWLEDKKWTYMKCDFATPSVMGEKERIPESSKPRLEAQTN